MPNLQIHFSEKLRTEVYEEHIKKFHGSKEWENDPEFQEKVKNEAMELVYKKVDVVADFWLKVNERFKEKLPTTDDKPVNKWLFDIRPRDELSRRKFIEFTLELFKKHIFKSYYFVFEQCGTSNDDLGKGLHFHSIVEFNSPTKGKKFFLQSIKDFIAKKGLTNDIGMNCVELQKMDTKLYYHNRIAYINTEQFGKKTEDKLLKWTWDKTFRQQQDLKDFYKSLNHSF